MHSFLPFNCLQTFMCNVCRSIDFISCSSQQAQKITEKSSSFELGGLHEFRRYWQSSGHCKFVPNSWCSLLHHVLYISDPASYRDFTYLRFSSWCYVLNWFRIWVYFFNIIENIQQWLSYFIFKSKTWILDADKGWHGSSTVWGAILQLPNMHRSNEWRDIYKMRPHFLQEVHWGSN